MIRNFACVLVVFAATLGVAAAEQFLADITKVEGNKVTFIKYDGKSEGQVTLPAADNVKVVRGSFVGKNKKVMPGDELKGGLSNERFKEMLFVQIITDADAKVITEIRVLKPIKEPKE